MPGARFKISIVIIAIALIAPNSAIAAVAGATCKKVGAVASGKSGALICKKVGGKLKWTASKSSSAPKPNTPVQFLSAAKAKAGAGCNQTNETAFTLEGPVICNKTWNLITESQDSVESRAYRKVLSQYLAKPEINAMITWRLDPNTGDWKFQMKQGMEAAARLFAVTPPSENPKTVYVSDSFDWLWNQIKSDGFIKDESRRNKLFFSSCHAGLSGADDFEQSGRSFWFYGFSSKNCFNEYRAGYFQVPAHEYAHFVQEFWSKGAWRTTQQVPWMHEGFASFIGSALGPMSNMRNDISALWRDELQGSPVDLNYFAEFSELNARSENRFYVGPVGAVAIEAMVALIGLDGIEKIYLEMATPSVTYDQAMRKVTGVGVGSWTELLNGYVNSVKSSSPWSLELLQTEFSKRKS